MIETQGVTHFSLAASDLDRSGRFYRSYSGWKSFKRAHAWCF